MTLDHRPTAPLTSPLFAMAALFGTGCCFFPFVSPEASADAPAAEAARAPMATRTRVEGGVDIRTIVAVLPDYKPDGRDWDIAGGAPDPRVRVLQDGFLVLETAVVRDAFEARFDVTETAQIDPARPYEIEVLDQDPAAPDLVGRATFQPGDGMVLLSEGGIVTVVVEDLARDARDTLEHHLLTGEAYADPPELEPLASRLLRREGVEAVAIQRLEAPARLVVLARFDPDYADPGANLPHWGADIRRSEVGEYALVVAFRNGGDGYLGVSSWAAGASSDDRVDTYDDEAVAAVQAALAP